MTTLGDLRGWAAWASGAPTIYPAPVSAVVARNCRRFASIVGLLDVAKHFARQHATWACCRQGCPDAPLGGHPQSLHSCVGAGAEHPWRLSLGLMAFALVRATRNQEK